MALLALPELVPGTTTTGINVKGERTSRRTYRCYCDLNDSDIQVIDQLPAGIKLWTAYPSYGRFISTGIKVSDAEKVTGPGIDSIALDGSGSAIAALGGARACRIWNVEVEYGPWTPEFSSPDGDPLNQPPRWWIGASRDQKAVEADNEGRLVLNNVGDPFDPPLQRDVTAHSIYIQRNETRPDFPGILGGWVDHVNKDPWNGFDARTLKVCPIELPDRQYSQVTGQVYYPMMYQLEFKPDTWDYKVPSVGFREFNTYLDSTGVDPDGNPVYPLRDVIIDGVPTPAAVFLDSSGKYLAPPVNKDSIVILTFKVYDELDFGLLGMDALLSS